jgi:hypothetical protein
MDNWELHEQYRPEARFGLFHVDRSDPALPRHITEGAFAYQQVIAESRATSSNGAPTNKALDAAEDAFGTVARDGSRIVPPTRTHGRFWEGTTSEGEAFTLYLGYIEATGQMTGMIFRRAVGGWRQMELLVDGQGSFFRESWHDDATGKTAHRDYRVTYGNGEWRGTFGGSAVVTAARVPGAGTWKWRGRSPWGGDHFYVSKFEGLYSGKFLTFSAPISGRDEPRPQCGPGCIPDVSGPVWKPFRTVEADPLLRLDGSGLEGEGLFDVSLAFDGPGAATTVSRNSGKFTVSKAANIFDGLFDLTGYLSPRGDFTWSGERNGSVVSQFRFLERRGIAIERPKKPASIGGDDDQYYKENDPTSVMPLEGFSYAPHFGGATVSFEAGGRRYQTSTDVFVCLSPAVCTGTWSDIAGMHAERLSEKFPPVPYAGPDRRIRARGKDAVIRLDGTGSFDLDGQALLYAWTGDFGTVVGPTPSVSLGVGTHEVCLDVTNGIETSRDCVTINVVRGPR